jgi:hypothetical protein
MTYFSFSQWLANLKQLFFPKKNRNTMPPNGPNLYALLVGINKYRYPVSKLDGCVADMKKVEKYLEREKKKGDFNVQIKTLTDKEATKSEVARLFTEHLGKAGPEDVAFFFFAGHGAQEWAKDQYEKKSDSLWRFEPDNKLEGIVCYDSITENGTGTMLVDKELRYLIHQIATKNEQGEAKAGSPHIVTIFDCCHSGENTRNAGIEEETGVKKRRYEPMEPESPAQARMSLVVDKRQWEDFLFADKDGITQQALKTQPLGELLPQARHVHLAACRSDEFSYESGGSGVFTKNLIEVLNRSQGGVTYYELRGRLKNYIKNQFRQTPQIYEAGGSQEIYRTFLNKKEAGKPLFGMISHNSKDGWILDMGAIHGISNQAKKIKVSAEDESEVFEAKIGKIESSWTEVLFEENDTKKLDKNEVYYGSIEGFLSAPIQVYLNNFDRDEEAKKRLKDLIEEKGKNLFFTEDEKGADYTVQMAFGRYHITEPEDIFRPLVMPTEDNSKEAAELAFSHLNHISQWEYVKNLENNGDNQLPRDAIKVEVFKVIKDEAGQEQLELLSFTGEDEILTSLEKKGNEYESTFRIKLTNMSSYKLWVSFIYLYKDFSADPEWFANLVQELEPREAHQEEGGSVWVLEDQPNIYFGLEDSTRIFNWAEDVSYFKVIASRQEFDVRQLKMEGLPDPAELAMRSRGQARAGRKGTKEKEAEADAWMTRFFTIRLHNPFYNRVSQKQLGEWMETEAAEFVYHLYLEPSAPFGGEVELREGVEWIDEQERGLFFKIKLAAANWVSRQFRHYRYKVIRDEEPQRIRIVSEGDSWFQHPHPAVKDIIDQLFDDFAIYSLGAGGDQLEKYFEKGEYKKALASEQPRFFLMSGGGNDILGKRVKDFINTPIDPDDEPEKILNTEFRETVSRLGDIYQTVFEEVKRDFPGVHILCHGYDYIYPDAKKGWYGRYAGKKITRPAHLKAVADFLIDHFNEKLAEATEGFDHVHYIDLRGMVKERELWYDEIHPTSDGFDRIAEKFKAKILDLSK